MRSTLSLLREEPLLRMRSAVAAFSMASYRVQLTALTFLLTRPPFGWNAAAIGLFGLLGVIGVVGMNVAAGLGDRGRVQLVSGGVGRLAHALLAAAPGGRVLTAVARRRRDLPERGAAGGADQ
ncbi:hypothetical protein [Streptomyces sp. NPDC005181]|uniref:hypothetical protein n=1 Tax=Streptomyces sp. NPDC005181 TaxID=3156869 RepID=UPI0033A01AB0